MVNLVFVDFLGSPRLVPQVDGITCLGEVPPTIGVDHGSAVVVIGHGTERLGGLHVLLETEPSHGLLHESGADGAPDHADVHVLTLLNQPFVNLATCGGLQVAAVDIEQAVPEPGGGSSVENT